MKLLDLLKYKPCHKGITRKVKDGLYEQKYHYEDGRIKGCAVLNKNIDDFEERHLNGECKWWFPDGTLSSHELWENGSFVKDYLKGQ